MKIKLKEIKIIRFKAINYLNLLFDGRDAVISGDNGSGKTSIYEAYYWCLFGKTLVANGIVQTLDKDNKIVHKVDTSVEVVLDINGEYNVTIQRVLTEKWKAKDMPDEKLISTEVQRFWNGVPVSMAEYKLKLQTLVPIAQWQLLSNNFAFMGYKMEDRRRMLMSITGEVNEEELMKPYPAIQKAVAERKSINELNAQTKRTRKDADKELKEIPAKISAQDILKVDTSKSGDGSSADKVEEYFKKLADAQQAVDDFKHQWEKRNGDNLTDIRKQLFNAQDKARKIANDISKAQDEQQTRIKRLATVTDDFNKAKAEWQKVNEEQYDFKQSEICPVCKQTLPEAFKRNEYANAVEEFNERKLERLAEIMKEAQRLSEQKNVLQGSIKTYNEIEKPKLDKAEKEADKHVEALKKGLEIAKGATLDNDKGYQKLAKALEKLQSEKPANADDIVKLKADQEINKRVEKEKERLQQRSTQLSQIIADCDNTLYQIFNYKKAKIDAVENKINGFFSLVRWKFFQANITNDDLQEICTCIVDGVDFTNLNTAMKVNASIDIINGISKATGIHVPCWIDNAESVNNIIASQSQQIKLGVSKEEFNIEII